MRLSESRRSATGIALTNFGANAMMVAWAAFFCRPEEETLTQTHIFVALARAARAAARVFPGSGPETLSPLGDLVSGPIFDGRGG
jgi:hypothetical protein